ncbi:trypsin, alkaline B-like [Manduca sexta]|uniref:trypsin, alkaline B-like n=1 Tax=Manduca sexta TaxID=7130 RepID=UPI001182E05F|nr:trypsin, alkaline B-like [Manduca sexta]XP_037302419.1 trypsin, alkaline B-like [Manduca sexta]
MKTLIALLALGFVAVTAGPSAPQRIVGGSVTTIDNYPSLVALLRTQDWSQWSQACGGSIINSRHILSAAHCLHGYAVGAWRVRVGSTWANSGGVVHAVDRHIIHYHYNNRTLDNDIAILRLASNIAFNQNARAGHYAGANYHVADNQAVWAAGWGHTQFRGNPSEQLRHVEVRTINLDVCRDRYRRAFPPRIVTDNMLCSGILDVGGRDACQGDSGGPVYHNNVIAGVTSWGIRCADRRFPGVNVRVQRYTAWIRNNSLYRSTITRLIKSNK